MIENTNTLEQTPKNNDGFEDILDMQSRQESERIRIDAASTVAPVEQKAIQSQEVPISPLKKKLVKLGAGVALVAAGGAAGFALGTQNEQALNDSQRTVAVDTISPSQEQGDLIGPAMNSVDALLEQHGLDTDTISYSDVQHELSEAMKENYAATGDTVIRPGDQFEVSLNTANGGILTGGAEVTSIDIVSIAAEKAKEAALAPPQAIPTDSNQ